MVVTKTPFFVLAITLVAANLIGLAAGQSRCNFTYTMRHGEKAVLKSPFYINNMESCWFVYKVDREGYGVRVDYASFELEEKTCKDPATNKTVCCDYLQIGAGSQLNTNELSTECGSTKPDSILVSSSAVWFKFHTNAEHTFDGFRLELTPYQLTFNQTSGLIASPELVKDVRYANNMNVTYRIEAQEGEFVSIRFQRLVIENNNDSCVDYLEIGSYDRSSGVQPIRFCGETIEPQFLINSNKVYLRFVTDSSVTASGFELYYKAIKTRFTNPTGTIQLFEYQLDVDYTIRAPEGFKIELDVREFKFTECRADNVDRLIQAPYQVCADQNDYLSLSNQIGSLRADFFKYMNESVDSQEDQSGISKWIFCDCNKPAKTYTSLTNELKISYVHAKTSSNKRSQQKNTFKIDYKFVPMQFSEVSELRIVQDRVETSLIGGYHLNIRVPANHHLRLYGKSNLCKLPEQSYLAKWSDVSQSTRKSAVVSYKQMTLDQDAFKKECFYLFDVAEPSNDAFIERKDDWLVSWYLKFNNPFESYDFEVNWKFIKNALVDEKKQSVINLPKEIGFDSGKDGLVFLFKSTSSFRKYTLNFEVKENELNRNEKVRDYIKYKTRLSSEYEKLADKTELVMDSNEFVLRIKRSGSLSLQIAYKIGSQAGDCNFDQSICNYTSNLLSDSAISSSLNKQSGQIIRHLPKYTSYSINDKDVLKKSKDFYLSLSKSVDNNDAVFSPLVQVQKGNGRRGSTFNKWAYSVSFSYRVSNRSSDQLELFMVKNVSDSAAKNIRPRLFKESIQRYDHLSWERIENVKAIQSDSICSVRPASLHMMPRFASLANPAIDVDPTQQWYRVNQVKFFSCYNFRLGFAVRIDSESEKLRDPNTQLEIGLDDVQVNQEEELRECEENVCGANGVCYMYENKPTCCCMPGFEGNRCERRLSACKTLSSTVNSVFDDKNKNICKNGGNCTDLSILFDYKCECPAGYTGKNCETEINECEPNPCANNGRCIDRIGRFECVCKSGFNGQRCERRDLDCQNVCAEYGTQECIKSKTPICVCKPGFTGDNCSIKIKVNRCLSSPCVGLSQCVNLEDSIKCLCPEDRTGKFCEVQLNYCDDHSNLCLNGSACVFANKDATMFNCSCAAGFTGKHCNETINDCLSNPCQNGKCIDMDMGFMCECERGYVGKFCDEKPKDPCYKHKCKSGTCVPKHGSWGYNCHCHPDAEGEFCDKKKCVKSEIIGPVCNQNGTSDVVVMNGKCVCVCNPDFTGPNCESRINLCELRQQTGSVDKECKNGGLCSYNNVTGSMMCSCPDGFTGDRCEIIVNNCKDQPCINGLCKNRHDSYVCECSPGWTGVNCNERIEVCKLSEDCVADNTLEVYHSKHSCICVCKLGFTGSRCETNIDDCAGVVCENGGTCVDQVGSYKCQCPLGYDGTQCQFKVVNCDVNPCKNGNCVMMGTIIKCECDRGYTGQYCDKFIDQCNPNPCHNDAVCHNLVDSYHCECPPEFGSSQNCSERLIDPCKASPCFNDGECTPITEAHGADRKRIVYTDFKCHCSEGFGGRLCEQPRNPCDSNPCHNRGQCYQSRSNESDYSCQCYPAYTGRNCELQHDPCKDARGNICQNGGKCMVTRGQGQTCKCPPNFSGTNCEIAVDPCDLVSCLNGGQCVQSNGVPFCKCSNKRYIGTRCEIDVSALDLQKYNLKQSPVMSKSTSSSCGLLGNDVKPTDLVFFWLMIFGVFVLILAIVYTYVYLRIKKTKDYFKNISNEKDVLEINDSTEQRRLA